MSRYVACDCGCPHPQGFSQLQSSDGLFASHSQGAVHPQPDVWAGGGGGGGGWGVLCATQGHLPLQPQLYDVPSALQLQSGPHPQLTPAITSVGAMTSVGSMTSLGWPTDLGGP